MNTMVLGFAGYGLLLSSSAALILLLKMGCIKDILKSPLHILSTSDTLISMITSIILLINQSIPRTNFEEVLPIAGVNKIANRRLLQDHDYEEYQNETCMRFYHKYNDSWSDSQAINGTTTNCAFQHILMHYAMFLVPFANTFMSLLIYSVQCSSGMACVNEKCLSLTKISTNMTKGRKTEQPGPADPNLSFRKRDSGAQEDLNIISKNLKDEETQETILTISNDESTPTNSNNDSKFTGFGLITQWLVPVLVTVILYFSKTQDMNKLRESNEMECIFKINFPLESCYKTELVMFESLRNPDERYSAVIVEVEDPDTLRISHPDSEAIDEVVSSVRHVVQSVLNKTCNNSTELQYYNGSRPWNITKYVTMDNSTRQMSNKNEMLEKLTDIQQALNNNNLGIFRNNKCATTEGNNSDKIDLPPHGDEELKFFEDVVKNTGLKTSPVVPTLIRETKPQDSVPQEVTPPATIMKNKNIERTEISGKTDEIFERGQASYKTSNENKTAMIEAENITQNSNEQIYTDIIKRIRDTLVQIKVKGQTGDSHDNYEKNNDESRTGEPEIPSLISVSRTNRADRKNSSTEHEGERSSQAPLHMNDRCFLSTKFLKIHLLILLFLIYFIPVLASGILQTRAIYMCKNVFEKIGAADNKKNIQTSPTQDPNKITIYKNPDPKPGWFLPESDDAVEADFPNTEDNNHPNSSQSFQRTENVEEENRERNLQIEEKKTVYLNVLEETKSMEMLFSILSKSLMLGILMWTPAFLEILSKVFLCASTPAWLVNGLYLLGVSFGMVKNFFNVNMARINKDINEKIYRKENSVHPSA